MIKEVHRHNIGRMETKYSAIEFIQLFRERILIFKEGDEIAIPINKDTYQTYLIDENGVFSPLNIYKIKT